MAETHGFIRLPPDSTGKRVPHTVMLEVDYGSGTIAFAIGDEVTFVTSGILATIVNIIGNTTTGQLHLVVHQPIPTVIVATIGEAMQVKAVTYALATNTGYPYYYQQLSIVGSDPENVVAVSSTGELSTKFESGSPEFDAFGKLRVSRETTIQEYIQRYDELPDYFTDVSVGSGTLTYHSEFCGSTLAVGTANGAKYQRTSNLYHTYKASNSQLIKMTSVCGDTGKTNVVRSWGYYDDDNGVFFRLNGTALELVIRSKTSGSIVDTIIPRTDWNGDRLDGSGGIYNKSGFLLDISKTNIWWIDLQWLGAGTVRFGANIGGKRITLHSNMNSNVLNTLYMSIPDLPLRYETYNSGISASTSEFTFFCATVKTEGEIDPVGKLVSVLSPLTTIASNTVPVVAIAVRPKQTYNTINNRGLISPISYNIFNKGTNPVIISVVRDATITNGTWTSVGAKSISEINTTITTFSGGTVIQNIIVKGGDVIKVNSTGFENYANGLTRLADISLYRNISLQLLCMETAQTADVKITIDLNEVLI